MRCGIKDDKICRPQDKCPKCGYFAVAYSTRSVKNRSKVVLAHEGGDFFIRCEHCHTPLAVRTELIHNAEAPAARVSG